MICPKCGGSVRTVETNPHKQTNGVKRRRECLVCNHRFTSIEVDQTKYKVIAMSVPMQLSALAENMIREHFLVQILFEGVHSDQDSSDLPKDAMADYRQAESNFLEAAKPTCQKVFTAIYYTQPYSIRCDYDREEVQIDLAVMLEAA